MGLRTPQDEFKALHPKDVTRRELKRRVDMAIALYERDAQADGDWYWESALIFYSHFHRLEEESYTARAGTFGLVR